MPFLKSDKGDVFMISVIIPVYNAEKYLRECVNSVCTQTYSDLQIILVDDGSKDASGAICDALAEKDPRVQVIHQSNQGVSAARNAGLKAATGDLVSFIDADDTLDPDMYEFLVRLMEEHDADISHCAYRHIVGEEVRLVHDTRQVYPQSRNEALQCLVGSRLFVGSLWNKLYRCEVLKGLRFDEDIKINEDILYNYFAFKNAGTSVFADVCKYNYIAHKTSSACFVTADVRKARDACCVNAAIYEDTNGTALQRSAAVRYLRALSGYFRVCCVDRSMAAQRDHIRDELWRVYRANPNVGRNMKITALLIHYAPWLYRFIYAVHDRVRKPNWEV